MRGILISLLVLGLIGCKESEAEKRARMAEQAAAARAAEEPILDPWGVWEVDAVALARVRGGEEFFPTANTNMDFKDTLADDASGSVTITQDSKFNAQITAGGKTYVLKGYIGIDEPNVEMFASELNGEQLPKKTMILGEVKGDKMMLHLMPWRIWMPMSRT